MFKTVLEVWARLIDQMKNIKGTQKSKKEVKVCSLAGDVIMYIKVSKDTSGNTV